VTLEDLQVAMGGITPPSFYHAFGIEGGIVLKSRGSLPRDNRRPTVRALEEGETAREA